MRCKGGVVGRYVAISAHPKGMHVRTTGLIDVCTTWSNNSCPGCSMINTNVVAHHAKGIAVVAAVHSRWEVILHRRCGRAPDFMQFEKACCPPGRLCMSNIRCKGHFTYPSNHSLDVIAIVTSDASKWYCSCNKLIADQGNTWTPGRSLPGGGAV
jgi:hypothetical protein